MSDRLPRPTAGQEAELVAGQAAELAVGPAAGLAEPAVGRAGGPAADPELACTAASVAVGEPLPGTAPEQRAWLLVEHPGPWGRDPLLDADWPDQLGRTLRAAAQAAGVKVLAMRRHRARPVGGLPQRPRVLLSWTGPDGWVLGRRLEHPGQLAELPLAELGAGQRPAGGAASGWREPGPIWAVCTHGVRDACCARLGRPIAELLHASGPRLTWEVSHTGGHRFGGVVFAFPEGLCYGRVTAERVPELLAARERSELVLGLLRGRCHLSAAEQAAESAVRDRLGLTRLDGVRPLTPAGGPGSDPPAAENPAGADGGVPVRTDWQVDGQLWRVDVHRVALPPRPASCGKQPEATFAWICDPPRRGPDPGPGTAGARG